MNTTQSEHAQTELAHELFAAAQLAPGEGIEDAVSRIAAALTATPAQPAAPQGVAEVNWWEADGDKYDASISPMQPAQGVAYAELPEPYGKNAGEPFHYTADDMRDFADRTHALRASNGQAPAGAAGEAALDEALRERDEADDFIDALLDEVLGADRAEWSSAYGRADALEEVRERITALHKPAVDRAWAQFETATQQVCASVTVSVGSQEFDLAETGAHFTTADMATACGQAFREGQAAQQAGEVALDAAMRAIQQAIGLIGEPADERMQTIKRVLRGAVIVAEDSGEMAEPAAGAVAGPSLQEIQWRNIRKVVDALADFCFGRQDDPRWGVAHVAIRTSLTAKDGLDVQALKLEPLAAPTTAAQADSVSTFQQRVQPWLLECFGAEIAADPVERNHRFLEEAIELVQSLGCTASEAHQLVDYVFGRPVGEPAQEVGGVMVTLAALCLASGLDMHSSGEVELARISAPELVAKIRAKQAAKPKHSPLPEAPTAQAAPAAERQYINGVKTVADLVNNLLLLDQSLPIYAAQHIQIANRRRTITVPPTVSLERVKDERWIGEGDELNAAVIWTRADAPAAGAVAGPVETIKFSDDSTADPVEKARRYLNAMADHRINSQYFFDDGWPKKESAIDAMATLAVLEQLAAAPTPDAQADSVLEDAARMDWLAPRLCAYDVSAPMLNGGTGPAIMFTWPIGVDMKFADLRGSIDAARKQGGAT